MMRSIVLACCAWVFCTTASATVIEKQQLPYIYYVTFPVQTLSGEIQVNGQYRLPRELDDGPIPAVVILHSTAGVDSTGLYYAKALNEAGYATLEIDMWSPRGFAGGSSSRPDLPQQTLPDAYAALQYLAEQDEIDASRIGVLGFSWGGVVSLLAATEQYNALFNATGYQFAAHVGHYPICYLYNNDEVPIDGFDLVDVMAPVLIQSGTRDDYDIPVMCPLLVAGLSEKDKAMVSLKMYPFAYHGWDRLEPTWTVEDPYAHLGEGGEVVMKPNPVIPEYSKWRVLKHFEKAFATD